MNKAEYKKKEKQLFESSKVPKIYQQGCTTLAWELGHSLGYYEVYSNLQDIVEHIFETKDNE